MEYKANWERFGKDGDYEYTVGDVAFPMPSDWIKDITYMPYNNDKYEKINEMIDEWRRGNMVIDITPGAPLPMDMVATLRTFAHEYKFKVKDVIFNNPATVVYWKDGTKTVVTDMDNVVDGKVKPADSYSKETGLALCYMKKALGNKGNYNNAFREWIKED